MATPKVLSELRCVWSAGATLGEGTMWSVRQQALYWVDLLGHRLHRYEPATQAQRTWSFEEEITAVAERAEAPGLIVSLRRSLAFFDPESGHLQRLVEPEPDRPKNRFNDGKCDSQGRFWACTMDFDAEAPTGALYRYEANGDCMRMDDGYRVTNGPAWSADGRTLYVNDTVGQRIHAFDVEPATGSLGNKRLWRQFAADDGHPDGMTTDAAGRLWIAHWGAGCVTCHHPINAEELLRIELPTSHITNCAFGGLDLKTLFITSARVGLTPDRWAAEPLAGALFSIDIDNPGLPAHSFAG